MARFLIMALALAALAGCAPAHPPSAAEQANAASCTASADAAYNADNSDALSRTSQTGVMFSATPDHVFDSQRMGSLHVRDSQIAACERNGHNDTSVIIPGPPPVVPHIVPSN